MNFAAGEKTRILGVEIGRREVENVERRLAFQNRAAHLEREFAADRLGEGRIGQRKTLHRRLALEQDSRRLFCQRTIGACAEGRLDSVDGALLDPDLPRVESAVDRRARERSSGRWVLV